MSEIRGYARGGFTQKMKPQSKIIKKCIMYMFFIILQPTYCYGLDATSITYFI
ncbi:MAG: hypothetical protein ACTSPY_00455 [Candidatus Helarchaeota archaeon]